MRIDELDTIGATVPGDGEVPQRVIGIRLPGHNRRRATCLSICKHQFSYVQNVD